jgi:hypothetical protein
VLIIFKNLQLECILHYILYNNTPSKVIVNAASNITDRTLIEAANRGRWYRPLYFNNLTYFWDKVNIWRHTIVRTVDYYFFNLHFILLFLNIWTLPFYCFRLKNVLNILCDFRVSNHCWAFSSILWLSKLPSNHSATVTTLLYSIISIYDSW